jgi:hypothetical protein
MSAAMRRDWKAGSDNNTVNVAAPNINAQGPRHSSQSQEPHLCRGRDDAPVRYFRCGAVAKLGRMLTRPDPREPDRQAPRRNSTVAAHRSFREPRLGQG